MHSKVRPIKAVIFDFDGTLTEPGALDFAVVRASIRCPAGTPVLEYVESLADHEQRAEARSKLDAFEAEAAVHSRPNAGAEDTVIYLRSIGIGRVIISRNSSQSIATALKAFARIGMSDFDLIISRDDPVRPKPSPDGIRWAAEKLGMDTDEMLVVGDYVFDIQAGQSAGATTVLLDSNADAAAATDSDYHISALSELKGIIRQHLPLPSGKLPNDLLEGILHGLDLDDADLLIRPGVGEDIAAVDVEKEERLALKSDPITFASDAIGHYAVLINANDIATSGAMPRWFLTTLLFPCGTTGVEIGRTIRDLNGICRKRGISLCGGHTEITDAVTRPVVTGTMIGTVRKERLLDKRNIRSGDKVLVTKAVAVEGTSIIAREFGERLKRLGLSQAEIDDCSMFLGRLSILEEARIAATFDGVSAMHDITEGGLATALEELSIAGNHRIRVDMERIPVYPQTRRICDMLGLDPLGLIGSGSLLICCSSDVSEDLTHRIREAGIEATAIADVAEQGRGIEAVRGANRMPWPRFEVDEIARLF